MPDEFDEEVEEDCFGLSDDEIGELKELVTETQANLNRIKEILGM